jgi:hypothetical protein
MVGVPDPKRMGLYAVAFRGRLLLHRGTGVDGIQATDLPVIALTS